MPDSRIFVSYACIGDEPGVTIGKRLVSDIRATQTEVVTDHETMSDERFMEFLNRELPQCGHLIVIQTPVSLQSLRVHNTVNMALALVAQQRMRGILRILATPSPHTSNQALWETLYTLDASHDYLRAREKVFIELGLINLEADDSFVITLPSSLSNLTGTNWPAQPPASMPNPAGSNWPAQLPASMPNPAGTNWPAQPPASMPRPAGSNWPAQPPASMPNPAGSNWPAQPPVSMPNPAGSNWPAQPPVSMPRPAGSNWPAQPPVSLPGAPVSQGTRWAIFPTLKNNVLALFGRSRTLSQANLQGAQLPQQEAALAEDRPLPLDTSRRTMIRWAIGIGVALILALAIFLLINYIHAAHPPIQHGKASTLYIPFFT